MDTEETLPPISVGDPLSVGEQLRQARRERSLSLEEAAAATRIALANLQAIEAMDFARLPADSFTRGQILLYAAFLGIDDRSLVSRFFFARDGVEKRPQTFLQESLRKQHLMPKKLAEPAHISSAAIAGILLLLIVCSFTGFCLYFSWNPFAFLTDRFFPPAASSKSVFHPADPATSNGGGQHNNVQLQAFFKKDSRVMVTLDNKPPAEQTYLKGANALWEADKQMSLEFFQPDSAELHLNGARFPFPDGSDGRFLLRLPSPPAAASSR
ncbi:MAG: helix-turn-helix domain-containing protein [Proteobacteria bacterium]|nr:helix-turn-helix domain-containing protein [Pseudomonadota bacterium]